MMRDLPGPSPVEGPMRELLDELRGAEELLALAAAGDGVAAATSMRVVRDRRARVRASSLGAAAGAARARSPSSCAPRRASGH